MCTAQATPWPCSRWLPKVRRWGIFWTQSHPPKIGRPDNATSHPWPVLAALHGLCLARAAAMHWDAILTAKSQTVLQTLHCYNTLRLNSICTGVCFCKCVSVCLHFKLLHGLNPRPMQVRSNNGRSSISVTDQRRWGLGRSHALSPLVWGVCRGILGVHPIRHKDLLMQSQSEWTPLFWHWMGFICFVSVSRIYQKAVELVSGANLYLK